MLMRSENCGTRSTEAKGARAQLHLFACLHSGPWWGAGQVAYSSASTTRSPTVRVSRQSSPSTMGTVLDVPDGGYMSFLGSAWSGVGIRFDASLSTCEMYTEKS